MTRHCANSECPGLERDGVMPEFVDGIVACIDCGGTLMIGPVPQDPPESPKFIEFETIFIASDAVQAHLLRGLLEAEGIVVYLKGEALTSAIGELPVHFKQVEVQVHPDQQSRSRAIALRFEKPSD